MVQKLYQTRKRCSAKVWGYGTEDYKMHSIINQRYPPFTVTVKSNPSSETSSTSAASCFVSFLLENNTVLLGQKPLDSTDHRTAACFIHNALHITIYLLNMTRARVMFLNIQKQHFCSCHTHKITLAISFRKNTQLQEWSWFRNNSWINKLILNNLTF